MRILLLIIIVITGYRAFGQIDGRKIGYYNRLEVTPEKDSMQQSFGNRIHSVHVIDARSDTAAMGYYNLKKSDALKYDVKPGVAEKNGDIDIWAKVYHCSPDIKMGFENWINNYLQCSNNESVQNKLLIVIKKFWLSPEADKIDADNEKKQSTKVWNAGVVCKLEFYLEKDSVFYPLYRVDSVYSFADKLFDYSGLKFRDNGAAFITAALKKSLANITDINFGEILSKRKKLLFSDIQREYEKKAQLNILKDIVLKKGVYKDFEEFKNNSPSITGFELRTGKMGDIMYVKTADAEYPARDLWGYCDGTDIFINSGDKYSKLVRQRNTFYFYGIKEITRKSKHIFMKSSALNYATNTGEKKTVFLLELKYYQVDMETGEVY